jgi:acetolactate synthase-1/2/3 large subunit
VDRLAYLAEFAEFQIGEAKHMILVDTVAPVSFFAYPGKSSVLVPEGCAVIDLASGDDDVLTALSQLADAVGAAPDQFEPQEEARPPRPTGELTAQSVAEALGATLPEGAIVADEANTSGLFAPGATAGCPPHDWLCLTGGSIGIGLPLATGAAVACPDRKVVCLHADGSAMYTIQALWTQAREKLDVTTILYNNRSYAVLNMELSRVGATDVGSQARAMLDLTNPDQDFVAIAQGMGVDAVRATDAEDLCTQLERCFAEPGPHLIEVVVPTIGL